MAQRAGFKNKRRRKVGDLSSLRRSIWAGILTAEELADDPDPNIRLRALHSLSMLAGTYLKTVEATELEPRLLALEQAVDVEGGRPHALPPSHRTA